RAREAAGGSAAGGGGSGPVRRRRARVARDRHARRRRLPLSRTMPDGARTPVLFVVEAVTLAQVVRLWTLAQALDPARYAVHFASARFDERIFEQGGIPLRRWPIRSLAADVVDRAVASGKRIYEQDTLAGYVAEERALLRELRPAVVVGDLRLSLPISAPLEKVP